jgi:hypothetical protein
MGGRRAAGTSKVRTRTSRYLCTTLRASTRCGCLLAMQILSLIEAPRQPWVLIAGPVPAHTSATSFLLLLMTQQLGLPLALQLPSLIELPTSCRVLILIIRCLHV